MSGVEASDLVAATISSTDRSTESSAGDAGDGVRAIRRALQCLRLLAERAEAASVTDIGRALGLPASTTHRILATLQREGLVEHDEVTRRYRIGGAVIRLALRPLLEEERVRRIARPVLEALHDRTGETVHLAVLRGTEVVTIEQIESMHALLVRHPRGTSLPAHATALGKALIAHAPHVVAALASTPLEKLTAFTVTDPDLLKEELAVVERRGFAVNERQRQLDTAGVAAPVFDRWSTPVAAIGVSGPISRLSGEELLRFGEEARTAAADLSALLKASNGSMPA